MTSNKQPSMRQLRIMVRDARKLVNGQTPEQIAAFKEKQAERRRKYEREYKLRDVERYREYQREKKRQAWSGIKESDWYREYAPKRREVQRRNKQRHRDEVKQDPEAYAEYLAYHRERQSTPEAKERRRKRNAQRKEEINAQQRLWQRRKRQVMTEEEKEAERAKRREWEREYRRKVKAERPEVYAKWQSKWKAVYQKEKIGNE